MFIFFIQGYKNPVPKIAILGFTLFLLSLHRSRPFHRAQPPDSYRDGRGRKVRTTQSTMLPNGKISARV